MVIQVNHLSKQFNNFQAVDDLSFSVNQGEVYGFLGQNGAGKSTTIRMLLSLIKPTNGNISIFGYSIDRHRERILERVGAVIEKPDLYRYLTGYENLNLFAKLSGKKISKQGVMNCLGVVGLEKRAHDPVRVYSQGMKQRLGIAIALVHDPSLIILDEPTNGLDPQGIADIRNLIMTLSKDQHKTVLVSSHLLSEIEQVADRMLIIDKGKKVVEGSVKELLNPNKVQLEIVATDMQHTGLVIKESNWSTSIVKITAEKILIQTATSSVPELTKYLVDHGVGLLSLRAVNSLEAYFLSLTSGNEV